MSKLPKVVIVDDHTLFREGMRLLIEQEGIGQVVAEANNGKEFVSMLNGHNPDIVLMDIEMPEMNGIEATIKAKYVMPAIKILALTMQSSKDDYLKMVNAGALGFVLKTAGKHELQRAIESVLNGEHYFCKDILKNIVSNLIKDQSQYTKPVHKENGLSGRELDVLNYLCLGLTVSEIAEKLFRSVKTVEKHRSSLLEKTNTKNTINLILYAIKNRLVDV